MEREGWLTLVDLVEELPVLRVGVTLVERVLDTLLVLRVVEGAVVERVVVVLVLRVELPDVLRVAVALVAPVERLELRCSVRVAPCERVPPLAERALAVC